MMVLVGLTKAEGRLVGNKLSNVLSKINIMGRSYDERGSTHRKANICGPSPNSMMGLTGASIGGPLLAGGLR